MPLWVASRGACQSGLRINSGCIVATDAPWREDPRLVVDPFQALFRKLVVPLPNCWIGNGQQACGLHVAEPLRHHQYNVRQARLAPPDLPIVRQTF